MVGVNVINTRKLSLMEIDCNLGMGAHDITLGATQTVDGKDVSGLIASPVNKDDISDRTRRLFIPTGYTDGTETVMQNFSVVELADTATKFVTFSFSIPKDFVTGSAYKILVLCSHIGSGNVYIGSATHSPAAGEAYTTNAKSKANAAYACVANEIEVLDLTPANPGWVIDDVVGVKISRQGAHGDDTAVGVLRVIGLILEYEGDM